MPGLRREEDWARQIVAAALEADVVQFDDGTEDGMYDLAIRHGDGTEAAMEVTAAAEGASIALWKLVNGGDDRWIEERIAGGWMVSVQPTARAKRLLGELPALLQALEHEGIRELARPRPYHGGHDAAAADLQIVRARQSTTEHPGSIYITIEPPVGRMSGFTERTSEDAAAWIGEFLGGDRTADVRRKLHRSGCAERHAFVFLPTFSTAPFAALNLAMGYGGDPSHAPVLPSEITHVWLADMWATPTGHRWSRDLGWRTFDKLLHQPT